MTSESAAMFPLVGSCFLFGLYVLFTVVGKVCLSAYNEVELSVGVRQLAAVVLLPLLWHRLPGGMHLADRAALLAKPSQQAPTNRV